MLVLDARKMVSDMKRILPSVFVFLWCLLILPGCVDDSTGPLGRLDLGVWMAIDPIQCLGNPWERDWLANHDGDYAGYPRDLAGQFEVIKSYYEDLGVDIRGMASRRKYSIVCCACQCARGDAVYVCVGTEVIETMKAEGFRLESPRMPGSVTWFD
jgi:hypothetical protein